MSPAMMAPLSSDEIMISVRGDCGAAPVRYGHRSTPSTGGTVMLLALPPGAGGRSCGAAPASADNVRSVLPAR